MLLGFNVLFALISAGPVVLEVLTACYMDCTMYIIYACNVHVHLHVFCTQKDVGYNEVHHTVNVPCNSYSKAIAFIGHVMI